MASNMHPDHAKPRTRRWFFKYARCSHAELLRFLEDRAGVVLDKRTNRARLTSRLRELDRNNTFRRFVDLPPELRLRVYEDLLAPDQELRDQTEIQLSRLSGLIHTALLRTSKAIYSEAKPILYDKNCFSAVLKSVSRHRPWGTFYTYTLDVECPGRNMPLTDNSRDNSFSWVLDCKIRESMFRGLKCLTINLDLGHASAREEVWKASRVITRLCLSMCGDSRMEELSFSLVPHYKSPSVAVSMLPHIFWPIILLRSKVVVRFEGVSGIQGSQRPEHGERESQRALRPPGEAEAMCKLVAKIRRRCEAARINARSDKASCATPKQREVLGGLVTDLAPLAVIVDTVDIASGSTRWKMLQELVDSAEAEDSGK